MDLGVKLSYSTCASLLRVHASPRKTWTGRLLEGMLSFLAVSVALGCVSRVNAASTGVTPIQKVLQLMEEMKAKAIKDKKSEEIRFAAFKEFCGGTSSQKESAVARAGLHIEKLDGSILKASTEIEALGKEIAELEADVARWTKDGKAAGDVRAKERVDYDATHGDYSQSIAACEQAISVLRALPSKVPQTPALLQLRDAAGTLKRRSPVASEALLSLLGSSDGGPEGIDVDAPKAYAYEAGSGGVIKMLSELRERFKNELSALQKEELDAVHAYENLAQHLQDQVELAKHSASQRSQVRAERQSAMAQAEGEKQEVEALKAKDESYLAELNMLCKQKSTDFENRQELRAGEIEALSKAIEIISSDAIAAERLPGASPAGTALLQFESRGSVREPGSPTPMLRKVASLLHERASALGSPTLALAAQHAAEDPFAKVKQMIKDLLVKLQEEAAAEADHKAWCDAELATNAQTREIKAKAVDELTAEAEKLEAESARVAQALADLADEIAAIDKALANATAERQEEKTQNAATIADARESSQAVAQALAVLRDFYAKASEAVSFGQTQQSPVEDAPFVFDSPYKGQQDESTGVLGLLEVIESDFARLETETDAAEQAAEDAHRNFVYASEKDKAVATADVDHKEDRQLAIQQMLTSTHHSIKTTQTELDAAMAYYDKLKPSCVNAGVTFEERVQRREEELESLRDAYKILSGEDVPSLRDMKAEQIGA